MAANSLTQNRKRGESTTEEKLYHSENQRISESLNSENEVYEVYEVTNLTDPTDPTDPTETS